jgi:phosphoribosylformimino-5-aminoimidazole carboxamide ribotide isomerase
VQTLPVDILDVVEELNPLALAGILIRGLQLDGPTRHIDLALVEDLVERSRNPILVSGKICSLNDLRALDHRGALAAVLRAEQLSSTLDARAVAHEFGS